MCHERPSRRARDLSRGRHRRGRSHCWGNRWRASPRRPRVRLSCCPLYLLDLRAHRSSPIHYFHSTRCRYRIHWTRHRARARTRPETKRHISLRTGSRVLFLMTRHERARGSHRTNVLREIRLLRSSSYSKTNAGPRDTRSVSFNRNETIPGFAIRFSAPIRRDPEMSYLVTKDRSLAQADAQKFVS